ncbi:zinc finger, C3HC4 type (RING finger) protein (macronuclear) [Tetrahymena thermophila SB210]|uniref:Zinc finger, C3HC4 type (RING finger) protein n=1 Tax=Tetrahymena thermophila (strain SB210) TaxID=312017 RepID=Q22ZB3_TETTS|nr:zinc finger, C3HC4 type (RING finger) protein [Tetrahymena thermophila SB210]EAR90408.2 zinc finger, C3HC4 type (RING finger) protein [Tetrahymena thermophila SB210]|eukprot:XP_001010653.2 zinc finger, C3HC4 type (RING finger) protein [Tetrahymena thermophila SB210]
MKQPLTKKYLVVISLLYMSLLSVQALDQQDEQENQPYIVIQSTIQLDYYSYYYTIPLDLDALKSYQTNHFSFQDETLLTKNQLSQYFVGNIAIEFQVDSDIEFSTFLYTTNYSNKTSLRLFKNVHNNNHLKINRNSDQKLEIILQRIKEQETDNDDEEEITGTYKEEQKNNQTQNNKQFPTHLNYTLKIINLNQSQKYCPYNCYGNGECQADGMCQCNEGFSPIFYCMIEVKDLKLDFEEISDLQISEIQNSPRQNKLGQSQNNNLFQMNYARLQINNIEDFKNQVLYKQQFYGVPNEILISFYYIKNYTDNQPSIQILDDHNYFKVLETEEKIDDGENRFVSTFQIINLDYYKFLVDQDTQGQLITFAYNKNLNNFQIEIQVLYDDFKLLYESIQILVIALLSILLFIFLAITLKKNDNQESQIRQLSIRQINELTYLKRSHQQNIDIQSIMKNQMISFVYDLQSSKNQENGTHAECFICLSAYEESDELCKTKCGHVFHKNCIQAWVSKNQVCPIDRNCIFDGKPISKEQVNQLNN